jgi:hypothetical protein
MSWFTKKDNGTNVERMPELPELPDSPNTSYDFPESQEENVLEPPALPAQISPFPLPITPVQRLTKDYYQENTRQLLNEPKLGMQRSKFGSDSESLNIQERPIENFGISESKQPDYRPPKDWGIAKISGSFEPSTKSFSKKDDSIYIRLDKFQITMEAFRDIKNKIREIEELLAKTKEIKVREEKEIEEWEREIESIKLRLDSINKEISAPEK